MSRVCPDDGSALERRAYRGLILDVCPVCGGVYFDEGEMAALQRSGDDALVQLEADAESSGLVVVGVEAPKRCPGCAGLMAAYAYRYSSDIMLDGCAACGGVWVQDGELQRIADHLRESPLLFGGVAASRRHLQTLRTASSQLA